MESLDHELWNSKGVIYCYTNKINGKRYVGQTINELKTRHRLHMNAVRFTSNKRDNETPIHRAMRKYGIENFKLEILIMNCVDYDRLNNYEKFYIKRFKSLANQNGYNVSDGGLNGNKFAGKTEEEMDKWKRELSEARKRKYSGKNHPWYGRKHSEETKRKISEAHKGKKFIRTEEYGKKLGQSLLNNPKISTKVVGIDIVTKQEYVFPSAKEAERNGFCKSGVLKCCNGEFKQSQGIVWFRYDEYEKLTPEEIQNRLNEADKRIVAVSIDTGEVLYFSDTKEASKYSDKITQNKITCCCQYTREGTTNSLRLKTHAGYRWYNFYIYKQLEGDKE